MMHTLHLMFLQNTLPKYLPGTFKSRHLSATASFYKKNAFTNQLKHFPQAAFKNIEQCILPSFFKYFQNLNPKSYPGIQTFSLSTIKQLTTL